MIDETHSPARRSWVASAHQHADFPIQNLPLCVFTPPGGAARGGVAIGDDIFDLAAALELGLFDGVAARAAEAARGATLNPLFALGREARVALRRRLGDILDADGRERAKVEALRSRLIHRADDCRLELPAAIGDYTDFFAGIHHATNAGKLFRPDNPLLPNYKYVPIGYHGRASSIAVSGATLRRPSGQRKPSTETIPSFGASRSLDYELELGVWIGPGNELGTPEALAPFRTAQAPRPAGDPAPLPHLFDAADQAAGALDVELEVFLLTPGLRAKGLAPRRLSLGNARHLYWTVAQLVAHHSSGGCNLRAGDLFGTGTISAPEDGGLGSLLEISAGGRRPVELPSGETRRFLEDGDTVIMRARCAREGFATVGLGECRGTIAPAI